MKILARYLFNNLLQPLLYLTLAFTLLFVIADLMDNASDFFEAGTSLLDMAYYYTLRLPSMVIMIVPICLLLAVLYSLSSLTRHNEITAMRASGISIYRIVRPYMLLGFFCFIITAVVNEYTGTKFAYRADQFVEGQTHADEEVYYEQIAFKNPSANHIWYIKKFDTRSYTMLDLKLVQQREDGTDHIMYNANKARWMDGRWWFEDGTIQEYDELGNLLQKRDEQGNLSSKPEPFSSREMRNLPEVPEDFMGEIKDPAYLVELYSDPPVSLPGNPHKVRSRLPPPALHAHGLHHHHHDRHPRRGTHRPQRRLRRHHARTRHVLRLLLPAIHHGIPCQADVHRPVARPLGIHYILLHRWQRHDSPHAVT